MGTLILVLVWAARSPAGLSLVVPSSVVPSSVVTLPVVPIPAVPTEAEQSEAEPSEAEPPKAKRSISDEPSPAVQSLALQSTGFNVAVGAVALLVFANISTHFLLYAMKCSSVKDLLNLNKFILKN